MVRFAGSVMIRARERVPIARMSVPRMRRMARRARRDVGIKATGRIMVRIVLGMSRESVRAV